MAIGGGALVASVAGLFLAESRTIHVLLGVMLLSASCALLAALYAALVERRTSKPIS
jgi:hypothetical protein